jgi:hypothetical protein
MSRLEARGEPPASYPGRLKLHGWPPDIRGGHDIGYDEFVMSRLSLLLLVPWACGDDIQGTVEPAADAGTEGADASTSPATLSETGLYAGELGGALAPGVVEYEVAWELWADGATKRRFVMLPAGEIIDTSSMDFWTVPVGTRLWKEFSVDGKRIETRLMWKQGSELDDWFAVSYAWSADGQEALAAEGGVQDALGTDHDIPRARDCRRCHGRQPDFVLGFSALQLDHAPAGEGSDVTLETLATDGRLSDPPAGLSGPYYPLPGDATARAALGGLHGNCGGCHHPGSDVIDQTPVLLRLSVADLGAVEDTPVFQSSVGQPEERPLGGEVTALIVAGDHQASAVWARMGLRNMLGMPPLATEVIDEDGRAALAAWIDLLPVE